MLEYSFRSTVESLCPERDKLIGGVSAAQPPLPQPEHRTKNKEDKRGANIIMKSTNHHSQAVMFRAHSIDDRITPTEIAEEEF